MTAKAFWIAVGGLLLVACGGGDGTDANGSAGGATASGAATAAGPKVPTDSVECSSKRGTVSLKIDVDNDGKPASASGTSDLSYYKICQSGNFFSSTGTFSGKISGITKFHDTIGDGIELALAEGTASFEDEQWSVTDAQATGDDCQSVDVPPVKSSASASVISIKFYSSGAQSEVDLNIAPESVSPSADANILAAESLCATEDAQSALYKALAAYAH